MERFLYKWLPILFGCHCRSDRSFFFRGKQFPICARCTGLGIGFLFSLSLFFWRPPLLLGVLLMVPLIVDGVLQLKTSYESRNPRRLITGILFAYGLVSFIVICDMYAYGLGQHVKEIIMS
ncbi:MAG: DUF2085 domain-containing protein [Clostridia bacterium]